MYSKGLLWGLAFRQPERKSLDTGDDLDLRRSFFLEFCIVAKLDNNQFSDS